MDLQDLHTQYDSIFDIQVDQEKKTDFQFWKLQANNFDMEELKNKVLLEMNLYKIVGKEKDKDIKPENLILKTKNHDSEISIADFGLADFYDINGNYEYLRCGTPGYVAPEVKQ
ncbi:Protein kinase-like domain [Pseudocohnilembus persalinus]|uniref:Protein kinase-like domain n=1 Tax=Pseudocohnilembus persalinus TaxID=266149 RepID=A0A0V0R8C7_PSEPJ|nr:Protein kinase-like domain [Pseudocohnilembus persalinus]|eukprot:KRX10624.1 Protein kinase-like domain [Pseudocohnilembus persalinus]